MTRYADSTPDRPTVVVAGASGFIGSALGRSLGNQYRLIGLSRSGRTPPEGYAQMRRVDLFSRDDTHAALDQADAVIYLVHSMMPSARLVQARFQDLDVICADNFARAAAAHGVKQILYVGGLQPTSDVRSDHLESREEVERVLAGHGVPVSTIRAGIVIGTGGSSLEILSRLVRRLPLLVCPSWTSSRTQPVALDDVVWALDHLLAHPPGQSWSFDIGGPDKMSYRQLMAVTARAMGRRRIMIPVPILSPTLSRLWVSLVTRAPRALVFPLIESLRHEMLVRNEPRFQLENAPQTPIEPVLKTAIERGRQQVRTPHAFHGNKGATQKPVVLSVQRMRLPSGADSRWAASEYARWIPQAFGPLTPISVQADGDVLAFRLLNNGPILLRLERTRAGETATQRVFRVVDGWLAERTERARLEFRTVLDQQTLIVAVHDYVPRLPWWIYRCSQALVHAWVMHRFRAHLAKLPPVSSDTSDA